jgi:hypothetical protein
MTRPFAGGSMKPNIIGSGLRKQLVHWGMPFEATDEEARQWIDDFHQTLSRYFKFIDIVWSESDRGCAICAAALIDDALEGVLRRFFLTNGSPSSGFMKACSHKTLEHVPESVINWLLTTRPQPPLGSFAVRAKLARALCLISDEAMIAMDMMRQMRNDAAHLAVAFAFSNPEYKIEKLFGPLSNKEQAFLGSVKSAHEQSPIEVSDPSRQIFEMATASIYFRLILVMESPDWAAIRWGDPLGPLDHHYDTLFGQPRATSESADDSTPAAQT